MTPRSRQSVACWILWLAVVSPLVAVWWVL